MKHDRGIRSFGCAQDDKVALGTTKLEQDERLPLGMPTLDKEKRNGKDSECVFGSMSGFPFLFFV